MRVIRVKPLMYVDQPRIGASYFNDKLFIVKKAEYNIIFTIIFDNFSFLDFLPY